jgi:UDP-N-acetylmuramyl pentapeptide phosphotransferase/UDP-N-acetylglucosamine-1-phosphate transferase
MITPLPSSALIILAFIISFFITFYGIPSVIKIARIKNLYDIPGYRASHHELTPRLGGTMIFAGVILASVLFTGTEAPFEMKYMISGLLILFFIGLKDDIISLQPFKKAIGQLIASAIIVIPGEIRISLNCTELVTANPGCWISIFLSIIIFMTLINSMNFIDGIDGLAAGVGIVASVFFGVFFILNGQISWAPVCFALTGSLIAFFWYNVFSKNYKIFLGDTGSMVIGFLLAMFMIQFLEFNGSGNARFPVIVAPSLALAVLIIPVFDLFRIVFVRIFHGKSPFYGDNNHIHHIVLKLAGSHLKATSVILAVNVFLVLMVFLFGFLGNGILISFLLVISIVLSGLVTFLHGNDKKKLQTAQK